MKKSIQNTNKILCIIDMQPIFFAAKDKKLQSKIIRAVKYYKTHKRRIILIEYKNPIESSTIDPITSAIGKYKNIKKIHKINDDGSPEICKELKRTKDNYDILICGVNTNCCIKDTVLGLSNRLNRSIIALYRKGCGPEHPSSINLHKQPNVKIRYRLT